MNREVNMADCCYSNRTAHHSEELKKSLVNRLNRIDGQVKAIRSMIEADVYCNDVLIQISAAKSALIEVSRILFEAHLKSCIVEQIQSGSTEIVDELQETIKRLMKS